MGFLEEGEGVGNFWKGFLRLLSGMEFFLSVERFKFFFGGRLWGFFVLVGFV